MDTQLCAAMLGETWAMRHDVLALLWRHATVGEHAPTQAVGPRKLPKVAGSVAVLPMYGMISQRASIWQEVFGGTATQSFGAAFAKAINSPKVGAVLIDVDSPGGTVGGVPELAEMIYAGSQHKPVAAIANSQMASAAYWLASQVGGGQKRLAASPGADVGSIGVFRMHQDVSEMLASDGVKVTFIATPEYKTEANPFEPLSAAALEHHQEQVNASYEQFVAAVARGRGASKSDVKANYGKGRMFHASQAAQMGLVDRVSSLPQLLSEVGGQMPALSEAESAVMQDELCHAWETGTQEVIIHPSVLTERLRLRLRQKT